MEYKMNSVDKGLSSSKSSNRSFGPKFEDSDAYKAVTLHVEENIKAGRKKEEKRQKRMDSIRELNKPEPEINEQKVESDQYF